MEPQNNGTKRRKRGRPPMDAAEKGVHIHPRVRPATCDGLAEIAEITGEKPGAILDRLVAEECERLQKRRRR